MFAGLCFPEQLAGLGIDGVYPREDVGEIHRVLRVALVTDSRNHRGGPNSCVRAEGPVDAARLRVEGIEPGGIAAEEDSTRSDRRLREHLGGIRDPKSPL